MTAVIVCPVPFEVTKLVCPVCCDPAVPTSSAMFCTGQDSKKLRIGEVPPALLYCGCWKELLTTPVAVA